MFIYDYERWIPGYEGLYSANRAGVITTYHKHFIKPRPLTVRFNADGYLVVRMVDKEGIKKTHRVHRLIAKAFLDFTDKYDVNHIDGVKYNNAVENLEMVTRKENIDHAFQLGLRNEKGCNHNRTKLNDSDIVNIRKLYSEGNMTYREIGNRYNLTDGAIYRIVRKINWGHIL